MMDPNSITFAIIALILGFLGGLFDNSFGMGYGMITPIFLLLGIDTLIIIPTLLLSQAITGFSGTMFHLIFKNLEMKSEKSQAAKIFFIFVGLGSIGTISAVLFVIALERIFMHIYLGTMMIAVGAIVFFKFKFKFSWKKLVGIGTVAGFNKAISGGGYGTLVTNGMIMSDIKVKKSVGITQFSEATLSALGFLLYIIPNEISEVFLTLKLAIIMVMSGVFSAPIGALIAKKLNERIARKTVGILSIVLGILTFIRIILNI